MRSPFVYEFHLLASWTTMSNSDIHKPDHLNIAIIGGGIGGLACAVALKKQTNLTINLYEQAAQITEIGAGVVIWPRTWEVLKSLGLENELSALLKEPPSNVQKVAFEMRLSDRKEGFTFRKIFTKDGGYYFHRADLQNALLRHIPDFCQIHLSHRFQHCEESGDSVKLVFENGLRTSCDIVIGADGIKSAVRKYVSKSGELVFTGSRAFRGLVPRETLERLYPNHRALVNAIMYNGKSKHIVVYPINGGRLINIAAFISHPEDEGKVCSGLDVRQATTGEILKAFSGWEPEAIQLLSTIRKPTCWPIQDLCPLKTYTTRRILLLGDAAHAMTPHLGAGAAQAIEDGFVLGYLFKLMQPNDPRRLNRLIQVYDNIRRPFANHLQKISRKQGYYNELNMPEFDDIQGEGQRLDTQQIIALGSALRENWDSWWQDCALADFEQALQILQAQERA
ncbi:salicylate hydroxylase [Lentinula raphanica]|nr:salicylate hydroxylase [Lentinula raphanica]